MKDKKTMYSVPFALLILLLSAFSVFENNRVFSAEFSPQAVFDNQGEITYETASSNTISATGRVIDAIGNTVSGVRVDFYNVGMGSRYDNAGVTNDSGKIIFSEAFADHVGTKNGWSCTGGDRLYCTDVPEGAAGSKFKFIYSKNDFKNAEREFALAVGYSMDISMHISYDESRGSSFSVRGVVVDNENNDLPGVVLDYYKPEFDTTYEKAGRTDDSGKIIFSEAFAGHIASNNHWSCVGGETFQCIGLAGDAEGSIFEFIYKKDGYQTSRRSFVLDYSTINISHILNIDPADDDSIVLSPSTQTITIGDTPTAITASGGDGSYTYVLDSGGSGIDKDTGCDDGSNTSCPLTASTAEGTATITVISGTETQTATITVQPSGDDDDDDDDDDQPGDPDPIPTSPGCGVINRIINNLPDRFASVLDIFGDNKALLNVLQCSANEVTFSAGKNDDDYYIWNQIYYSKNGGGWEDEPLLLSGGNESGGWIIGQGTASTTLADSEIKLINYAAMYYCVWQDPDWKCGCSDTECNGDSARNWSLQSFEGDEDVGDDDDDSIVLSPSTQTFILNRLYNFKSLTK